MVLKVFATWYGCVCTESLPNDVNTASPNAMKTWCFKQFSLLTEKARICLKCAKYQGRREISFSWQMMGAFSQYSTTATELGNSVIQWKLCIEKPLQLISALTQIIHHNPAFCRQNITDSLSYSSHFITTYKVFSSLQKRYKILTPKAAT
jgi:hypothetical protein